MNWEMLLISFVVNLIAGWFIAKWAFRCGYRAGSAAMTEIAKAKMTEYHKFAVDQIHRRFM